MTQSGGNPSRPRNSFRRQNGSGSKGAILGADTGDSVRTAADVYGLPACRFGRWRTCAGMVLGPDKGEVTGSTPVSPTTTLPLATPQGSPGFQASERDCWQRLRISTGTSVRLVRYPGGMAFERITIDPAKMRGAPCIRGLRIPVAAVLGQLAAGRTTAEILTDFPDLEAEDIRAALEYAAAAVQERELPLISTA